MSHDICRFIDSFFYESKYKTPETIYKFSNKKKHLILGCYIYGGLPELKLQCYDKFKYTRE